MRLTTALLFVSVLCVEKIFAFVPNNGRHHLSIPSSTSQLSLGMDPSDIFLTVQQQSDSLQFPQLLLADGDDVGAWQSYINLFKASLTIVHDTISGPLANAGVEKSWGISIAIFTALARSLLLPLSIQQSKSSEYIKALKPYVSDIKKKYKDNQDLQNKAIGKLYEDANQNPLAGCFTSLAQLPIFLGLYRGVRQLAAEGSLEGEGFLWIPSLSGPVSPPDYRDLDWLTANWVDGVPPLGWETTIAFLTMPVILVVLQSVTMNILSPPPDEDATEEERQTQEQTQTVLKFLPLMIGFFSLQVPAGLTIYWFTTNIFTLTQSLSVRAYFAANPPKIELPDYWDALKEKSFDDMTPEERRKASKAGIGIGPKFQDLEDEARFHSLIERRPLRTADQDVDMSSIASELQAWVEAGPALPMQTTPAKTENTTATATA